MAGKDGAVVGLFTEDIDAYDIYLKALEQQAIGTIDALAKAETLLNKALLKDPSFVDAKLALVRNINLEYYTGTGEFDDNSVIATRLLTEVLAEDPDNLAARQYDLRLSSSIAIREMDMITYHELMGELLLTFQEGYGNPFVRADVARYLVGENRPDEALQLLQEALVTDPLNVALLMAQATLLRNTTGLDAAKAAFFSIYTEDLYILSFAWHIFKRAPWAAELRADPEVAAIMAAREVRIAEIRERVLEMMQEPEWQRH